MPEIIHDAVLETTTTQGTGALSLLGAQTGYNAARDKVSDGEWACWVIEQRQEDSEGNLTGIDREVVLGKLTYGTPDSVARTHVLSSTNADANVDFGEGTKDVMIAPGSDVFGWNLAGVESRTSAKTLNIKHCNLLLLIDATGGAITQYLPAVTDVFAGYRVTVLKSDSSANAITADGDGAETINGATTYPISKQYQMVTFVCTGAAWLIDNQNFGNNFAAWADFHGVGRLDTVSAYTKMHYYTSQALTDGATVDWDLQAKPKAKLTAGGDRAFNAPTNITEDSPVFLKHIQDATGGRNPSWNAAFDFSRLTGGIAPDLSARTNGQEDVFVFICNSTDGTLECINHIQRG